MLKFTKELNGETIYMVGTGNIARRGNHEVIKAKVIKVNPKSVKFKINGSTFEDTYKRHFNSEDYGNHLDDGSNGGYKCYYSLEEIEQERQDMQTLLQIKSVGSHFGASNPTKDINKIKDILFSGKLKQLQEGLADLKNTVNRHSKGLSLEEYDHLYGDIEALQNLAFELRGTYE